MSDDDPVELSADLLSAVRTGGETADLRRRLRDLDPDRLAGDLDTDGARKAFWINVYNAYAQIRLAERGGYGSKRRFFGADQVPVAGRDLSLDRIEHGVLRRSQISVGMGYVGRPEFLVGDFERRMRVDEVDPRIHFALNCGAASCPPIGTYTRAGIDEELETAAESYLGSEVEYDPETGRAEVPPLLLWYRGDFGGRSGIYDYLRRYGPVPAGERPSVSYRDYDWSVDLGNFRTGSGGEV
ncbi:DUF547 domain-containing protein [Halobacteriales archaeon QS_8_69_26]|nr:MAG: DUF547 domain-containing protein [Halobacteriales archaeon QS_8_69_26]